MRLPVNFSASGRRLQKIPVNGGFTCPNRDGSISRGGCHYCSPLSFTPFYCSAEKSVTEQLEQGIEFFSKRYTCHGFLAYFQAFSATYAPISVLENLFAEALSHEGIEGLVIATRPDCFSAATIQLLKSLGEKHYVRVELGIESLSDTVLQRINRGHDAETAVNALKKLQQEGLEVCAHMIIGLPGETRQSLIAGARCLSSLLPLAVKLHHLQIVEGSVFAGQFKANADQFSLMQVEDYLDVLALFISNLAPEVIIERLIGRVPPRLLLGPLWGGIDENFLRKRLVEKMFAEGLAQGCCL